MSHLQRQALYFVIGILLVAASAWWWFTNMERRWTARADVSEAVQQNPMLGAERLLTRRGYTVNITDTLAEALRTPLRDGTLLLLDSDGLVTPAQAALLMDWASRGNTLVVRPKRNSGGPVFSCSEPGSPARAGAANDDDPIGKEFGVGLAELPQKRQATSKAPPEPNASTCPTRIILPGKAHALQLAVERTALVSPGDETPTLASDEIRAAVRIYARGSGRVVFLAQNYFDNGQLPWYDNAELLLGLAALNRHSQNVLIVRHLDMPTWYEALWWHFKPGIVSAGIGLALLFWLAVRRFGPLLPEPDQERRSLIEHIDASGRWLWKVPGGRNILLDAVRSSTEKTLTRRVPELLRLSPAERAAELAQRCRLPKADVARALLEPASTHPFDFTRQIQTLQQLRKHHER